MNVSRSQIQFLCGQRSITIRGELLYPAGKARFAINRQSIRRWDDGSEVVPLEIELVISEALDQGAEAGVQIDVEMPDSS
jgi:hypothetical protein